MIVPTQRSASPSKFESHGTGSPTKLSVPNRKLRNQPSNRMHDIEFAAEISTSLIAQVRGLQALLAEKEEEVRDLKAEKSQLELETEGFQQRVKTLDESEHRYKDENWNLETQIRDLLASQKDGADREKKLGQSMTILKAEKNAALRELDELKVAYSKLGEDFTAAAKHHDVELGAAKRSIATADNERAAMQRKMDDLTNQNQELAKAFSMQRGRTLEHDGPSGTSEEDFETATDNMTPEHSPPPSPIKGTPRHSMLESETLRTSFQHLQRQLQLMRTNLHREKAEKLELRRLLQESRDEADRTRFKGDPSASQPNKRSKKKKDGKDSKKLKPAQLGALRIPRGEVLVDDFDWEDQMDSPCRSMSRVSPVSRISRGSGDALGSAAPTADAPEENEVFETAQETSDAFETAHETNDPFETAHETSDAFETAHETSDAFETAHETSDAFETAHETSDAFETGNERGGSTETEYFQTGAEEFSGDDTETERAVHVTAFERPDPVSPSLGRRTYRSASFHSTASTSADEREHANPEFRTPPVLPAPQRMRPMFSRGALSRRSRRPSEEPRLASSPASFGGSIGGTPQAQQSLFAELGDLEGSDDDSVMHTPSRRSVRSMTPASTTHARTASPPPAIPPMPKVMVDSGVQTDMLSQVSMPKPSLTDSGIAIEQDVEHAPLSGVAHRPKSMDAVLGSSEASKRLTDGSFDSELSRPLWSVCSDSGAQYDPEMEQKLSLFPAPPLAGPAILPPAQRLAMSSVESYIDMEPTSELQTPSLELVLSSVRSEEVAPVPEEVLPPPQLRLSAIVCEAVEPKARPEGAVDALSVSAVAFEQVEPISPELSVSALTSEQIEPVVEPEDTLPKLSMSNLVAQQVEPIATLEESSKPDTLPLSLSAVPIHGLESVAAPRQPLVFSSLQSEAVQPIASPQPSLQLSLLVSEAAEPINAESPLLSVSAVASEAIEPIQSTNPLLTASRVLSESIEPIGLEESRPIETGLTISSVVSEEITPISRPATPRTALSLSAVRTEAVKPLWPLVPRSVTPPPLVLSSVATVLTNSPVEDGTPKRSAFMMPRGVASGSQQEPPSSAEGLFHTSRPSEGPDTAVVADGETRQSRNNSTSQIHEMPEPQWPLRELSKNSPVQPPCKTPAPAPAPVTTCIDHGSQTSLRADEIDRLLLAELRSPATPEQGAFSLGGVAASLGTNNTPSTVRRRPSDESVSSVIRQRGKGIDGEHVLLENLNHRPGSSSSARAGTRDVPPLPANHREVIEAARSGSAHGGTGTMGPPLLPASALRSPTVRVRTPPTSPNRPMSPLRSGRGTATSRTAGAGASRGIPRVGSPSRLTESSRQSSVSSFASELDLRFQLQDGINPHGFAPGSDPRMIQAVTQTMIGEYLWKYTRKTASSNMSQTRHRRYFWVHPYTRTLYWSDRDPSAHNSRPEGRTKSVQIEAVRVVTDDNPYPPGLHRKSLIVISPGRTIKFTCQTGQRHETWLNALSYLLLRTSTAQQGSHQAAGIITQEDVDEFNPGYNRRHANGNRPQASPSLSYNSRPSGTTSPVMDMSMKASTPMLRHSHNAATQRPSIASLSSRISGYWNSGTFSTLRGRAAGGQQPRIYEAGKVHDSAEDLRHMIQQQDRDADRLENVRACCDGKHDVGALSHTKRDRAHPHPHPNLHAHGHPGLSPSSLNSAPSPAIAPMGTLRSRA